ncbi:hypothetical protein CPG37_07080 [Malaciobacter canalis]|uniref:Phage-like element PBSX protein XkdF domain-containing protein n=1 Tax=Malaciobacter canalis TaxID=1912871 RepID=A0ABX4LPC6_9BACT|nr:XkdF-like putative serine protease domain-containing protein [Malaciobacter canalis]PHO09772.1 hypothetical protein CPG37_07080 [Malaciobacter canalis]QEE33390.1 putative phage serine protease, peptidase S78 family [Malaciobacter canalis]
MPKLLKNIKITHISLVKSGANQKEIIYKSSDKEPLYAKQIQIKKSDEELGVVYGIVYAPASVDTDGDYTNADEILKAAYDFMKNKNTGNVDKDHTFEIEKAYVAESWILKENDAIFPDEPIGSWAVAIKLEDEELKKAVKDGDIAGISMAGTATKEDDETVSKADDKNISLNDLIDAMKKAFGYVGFNLNAGYDKQIDKSKKEGDDEMTPEQIATVVKDAVEPLTKQVGELQTQVQTLQKSDNETKETLKKSKQNDAPQGQQIEKEDELEGIL